MSGAALSGLALIGCASVPDSASIPPATTDASAAEQITFSGRSEENVNPLFVGTVDNRYLWESVVDVIDDYFPIDREYPIQSLNSGQNASSGRVMTEGRIDTKPVIAAGVLQPWKKNSVSLPQRVEATFQTIRRQAVVRIVPEESGYLIHLAVYNQLENLPQPMQAGTSGTNLLFTDDLSQLELPTGESATPEGWIPTGRDFDLEQYILHQIAWRLKNPPDVLNPQNAERVVP